MKFPQFVKEFRSENKDLGMSFADCMKSDEVKKAFKELCGCPRIEQKDGNVNVILQFGNTDDDAQTGSPDRGQGPRPGMVRQGIPQRKPQQIPPMYSPPPPPQAPLGPPPLPSPVEPKREVKQESELPPTFTQDVNESKSTDSDSSDGDEDDDEPFSLMSDTRQRPSRTLPGQLLLQDGDVEEDLQPYQQVTSIIDDDDDIDYDEINAVTGKPRYNPSANEAKDDSSMPPLEPASPRDRYNARIKEEDDDLPDFDDLPALSYLPAEQEQIMYDVGEVLDDVGYRRLIAEALEALPSKDEETDIAIAEEALDSGDDDSDKESIKSAPGPQALAKLEQQLKAFQDREDNKEKKSGQSNAGVVAIGGAMSAVIAAIMKANGWSQEKFFEYFLKVESWTEDDGILDKFFKYFKGMPGGWSQAAHQFMAYMGFVKAGVSPDNASTLSAIVGWMSGAHELWEKMPLERKLALTSAAGTLAVTMQPFLLNTVQLALSGASMAPAALALVDPTLLATITADLNPEYVNAAQEFLSNVTNDQIESLRDFNQRTLSWAQQLPQQVGEYVYGLADQATLPFRAYADRAREQDRYNRMDWWSEQRRERERQDDFDQSQYGFLGGQPRRRRPGSFVNLDRTTGTGLGGSVLNCCPAARGGSLKASDLRKLLESSYTSAPVDSWKMEKSMSSRNSKVFRNPSTGQVVVAHKGTQGTMDWGNNLVYAVTGEMGYKQTKRYKDALKVQKAAENAFGRDMVTTIGHSQGGLQAQMLGGDSKEIITVNKATRPGEAVYGSSKKRNQTDVRTSIDPVSAFRSPFASKKKQVTIDADTTDPVDAHSYKHLDKLGDTMIGEGVGDSKIAALESDFKRRLWDGKFNVPGEWDDKLKTWINVKAYRSALARMEPQRKKELKLLQARLDKDRDAQAKIAIKQKKAQKGRFK